MTYKVYPGCAVPPATGGHVWYIDPINGSSTGDGSAAHPWKSAQAIANSVDGAAPLLSTVAWNHKVNNTWTSDNSSAPIKAGDTVLLMSGNYGAVTIGHTGLPVDNPEFVTLKAAPHQTPVFTSLHTISTSKWVFDGITFEGTRVGGDYLSRVNFGGDNLILANCTVRSIADTSLWTRDEWMTLGSYGGVNSGGGSAHSFVNNVIENIINAFGMADTTNILFQNNTIRNFGWDAIDVAGVTNVLIFGNKIHDHIGVNDEVQGWHSDAIQFMGINKHIVIDSNHIVQQTRADLPWPGSAMGFKSFSQGIGEYGGTGPNEGIVIRNNVVIVRAYSGIDINCVGAIVINNTVLNADPNVSTWIAVRGVGGVCRNNIAPTIMVNFPGVVADHNIAFKEIALLDSAGVTKYFGASAATIGNVIGNSNQFALVENVIKTYNTITCAFDASLHAPTTITPNPAIGSGSPANIPALDLAGKKRIKPYSIGAYAP